MSAESNFEAEIAATVTAWDRAGKELVPAFITHEIVTKHEAGLARTNEHTEFFKHYAYKGHRKDVGAYIAKVFGDTDDDEQKKLELLLPGFEHIQRRYIIKRSGEDVAVHPNDMSDEEISAREQLLRRRGKRCIAHADELRRFKAIRKAARAEAKLA
jgi:hypothetical protein